MANRKTLRIRRYRDASGMGATTEGDQAVPSNRREVRIGKIRWIDIPRPTPDDVDWLGQEFGFHPLALEDALSPVQRPKLDDYDDYMFLVLHFPVHYKASRVTVPAEVDIFVGRDYVVTLHDGTLKPLVRLFDSVHEVPEDIEKELGESSGRLVYQIIDGLVGYCFPIINKVGQNIDSVEDLIFEQQTFRTVEEISILRRDIIALRRIIRPQMGILRLLERREVPLLGEDIEVYFGAVLDDVSKLWDILEDYKDVVEGLSEANDSLTSHRLNEIIKVLTMLSVIMLPLTLITSIYGMNVDLPFQRSGWIDVGIFAAMFLTAFGMLTYFRARRWL